MAADPKALDGLIAGSAAAAPTGRDDGPPVARGRRWSLPLLGALPPLLLLVLGESAVRLGWVPSHLLPAPSDVLRTLGELGTQDLLGHLAASTARVAIGFVIGTVLALALGAAVGLSRRAEALLDPSFQALRAIPSLAWVPLLLLWLGIDEAPKIVLIAIGAFFPVYMGVASGFRDVDRKLVEVGRMYRLGRWALVRRILMPAALPSILTGLRNGLSLAWMFMVAAELIAASQGLGYLLTDGRETSRADIVLAAIVLLALLGKLSDGAMRLLERRLLRWRDTFDQQA
jgi:sulfonate transport system permease protein